MKILVGCEESGVLQRELELLGHDAWSCDLLPSRRSKKHLQCDVREILDQGWDAMVAFPPCTYLAVSRNRWQQGYEKQINSAVDFIRTLWAAPIKLVAVENPKGRLSALWRKWDQIVHPYQFGHMEKKTTCLWLKGLPKLQPTKIVPAEFSFCHRMGPHENRARDRAETYSGIARAMATQWFGDANG